MDTNLSYIGQYLEAYQNWVGIYTSEPVLSADSWLVTGGVRVNVILEELRLIKESNPS